MDEAGDASQPPPAAKAVLPPATPWFNAGSRSCEPFETDRAGGTFPGGKPLVWLAQYLKARTNKAKLEGQEQAYAAALGLAAREETELEAHLTNLCVAVRQLLWPCSVTVSKRRTIKRALPPPTPPPKPEGGGRGRRGRRSPRLRRKAKSKNSRRRWSTRMWRRWATLPHHTPPGSWRLRAESWSTKKGA